MSYSKREKIDCNVDILTKARLFGLHIGYVWLKGENNSVSQASQAQEEGRDVRILDSGRVGADLARAAPAHGGEDWQVARAGRRDACGLGTDSRHSGWPGASA